MEKKKKKLSRSKLVHLLDSVFSQYIRLLYSNPRWYCQCFTCGDYKHRKTMQNAHFISRGVYKYRRDEENCYPGCYKCNIILHGNYKVYVLRMIDKYGRDKIDQMINDREIVKISTAEIMEKIEHYKLRVIELEKNIIRDTIYKKIKNGL